MKYNKSQRSNLNQLALNRFDNDVPREMWFTEGSDFLSVKAKLTPYDVNIYKAIEYAIAEGIIVIDYTTGTVEGGDNITVTGTGTVEDPFIVTGLDPLTAEEIKTLYESNADTNAFTDLEKIKLENLINGAFTYEQISDTVTSFDFDKNKFYLFVGNNTNEISVTPTFTNITLGDIFEVATGNFPVELFIESGSMLFTDQDNPTFTRNVIVLEANAKYRFSARTATRLVVTPIQLASAGGHPLIDDDTFATALSTNVASAESIKAYVDANKMAVSGNSSGLITVTDPTNLRFDLTQFELFPDLNTGFVEVVSTTRNKLIVFSSTTTLTVANNTKYVIVHPISSTSINQIDRTLDVAGLNSGDIFEIVNPTAAPIRLLTVGSEQYGKLGIPNTTSSTFFLTPFSSYSIYLGGTTLVVEKIANFNIDDGLIRKDLRNIGYDITPNTFNVETAPIGGGTETIDFTYFPIGNTAYVTVIGEDAIVYSAQESATLLTMQFYIGGEFNTTSNTLTVNSGDTYLLVRESIGFIRAIQIAGTLPNTTSVGAHTHVASEVTDFDVEVSNNANVVLNTAKLTANTTNVDNAGAVMEADTTTANMSFVIDEDDFISNSPTKLATQQSIKAYVDAQLVPAGAQHVKQKSGKAQYFAKTGTTTYTLTNGVGLFNIAEAGDLSSATIIVDRATDAVNDNFTLVFDHLDNTVNTWIPDADGSVEHDLHLPQYRIFNALSTRTPLFNQALSDRTTDTTIGIVPEIEFGNGQVQLIFADDNAAWTSTQRIVIQVNFTKL